jgi:selenocysteine-specific elongation factor
VLAEPLAVVEGDRYIIRSPVETSAAAASSIPAPTALRSPAPQVIANLQAREGGSGEDALVALLEAGPAAGHGRPGRPLPPPGGTVGEMVAILVGSGRVVALGEGERAILADGLRLAAHREKTAAALAEYHKKYPARTGMPRVELNTRLKLGDMMAPALESLIKQGVLAAEGGYLRLPSHRVQLTPAQQAKVDAFLKSLAANPYAPPGDFIPEPDLLNMLVEQGKVVKVSDSVVFAAPVYAEMRRQVTARIKERGKIALSEVRDMFGTSRKYAQAFLEQLDREKVTRRVGDDRVLC